MTHTSPLVRPVMSPTQSLVDTNNRDHAVDPSLPLSSSPLSYLSELRSPTLFVTPLFIFCLTAKLLIRSSHNAVENLPFSHSNRDQDFEQQIDPIFKLKSPLRVKPKGRPPGAKNKKRSHIEAGLDDSTCREPSSFEHEERIEKSKKGLGKKLDSTIVPKGKNKRQKATQSRKRGTTNRNSKSGEKEESTNRSYSAKIPLVALESEEESDQIVEVRKNKKEQHVTRLVGMSTRKTQRE